MKTKFFLLAILFAGLFVSCSNEEDTTTKNSDPESYFPLTNQNLWSYKKVGDNLTEKTNFTINGELVKEGKTYFFIISENKDTLLLRKDGAGNVVHKPTNEAERIFVPKTPTLDQYWFSTDSVDSICVTSLSKVINAYTDLVEVTTYERYETDEDNYKSLNYFRKGIGCIQFNQYGWDNSYTLYSYELK